MLAANARVLDDGLIAGCWRGTAACRRTATKPTDWWRVL